MTSRFSRTLKSFAVLFIIVGTIPAIVTLPGCAGTAPLVATTAVAEKFADAVGQAVKPNLGGMGGLNSGSNGSAQYCSSQARVEGANDQQIAQVCSGASRHLLLYVSVKPPHKDFPRTNPQLFARTPFDRSGRLRSHGIFVGFSHADAVKLCAQSPTEAPASCARQATTHLFTQVEAIQLCSGAYSEDPAYCAQKLKFEGKPDAVAVKSCSAK